MILEGAVFHIPVAQQAAFEAAFEQAQRVLARARGYLAHELQQCLEQPQRYLLLVEWESLEHHETGFRQSADFQHWRALIGPFFAEPPQVAHYQLVAGRGFNAATRRPHFQD
ncbi:antibiotic biosynthesis monooxygenase family protein [Aquabacterium sp.]|uniref:antibiotic biosynthesis monooxygenase family protein n=1 Tax=Aquabacterium sp. TaxID=1872578 RepID=UPI002C8B1346|nr:antibiotic biosynthesis monooxygenase [Aquabacterium sp.]HSW04378.1 antibiotic biosynthesis monooxygenase [Aquabacterium sp.]